MKKSYGVVSILLVVILLLFSQPPVNAQTTPQAKGTFLSVSDLHFNPYFDQSLLDTLMKSDYTNWYNIFESSSIKTPNSYGSDANYPLVKSALQNMQQQLANPDFIIITGDFLRHRFRENYNSYFKNYPDSFHAFTSKTIRFLAWMLDKHFPQTVILPVLGNNDAFCGDYEIAPKDAFLTMFASAFAPLQRNNDAAMDSNFINQFSKGGYYTFSPKTAKTPKFIMLNTIFFSVNYEDTCAKQPVGDPGGEELKWLADTLSQANAANQPVWMAYHIPPGVDVFATLKNVSCSVSSSSVMTMWNDSANKTFLDLVRKNAPVIRAGFAGHTHMDDFRVVYDGLQQPVSFIHITPAVSPLFYNNPGFQRLTYDTVSWSLLNSETFYLNVGSATPAWAFEYDFKKTYNVKGINAASLHQLRIGIRGTANFQTLCDSTNFNSLRASYVKYYNVSNVSANTDVKYRWKAYWCGTGALTKEDFLKCCGGKLKLRK
ncbi:MAG: metallophosphoesterase [Chitinophagaceae bacterium]